MHIGAEVNKEKELLLYDPQTSGGFLMAVSGGKARDIVDALAERRVIASDIGEVVDREDGWTIRVE